MLVSCIIFNHLGLSNVNIRIIESVPHSQCSLWENLKFSPNFKHKNDTIKVNLQQILFFNICLCNYGFALKGNNYWITKQICVYFIRERKWALWMRHLVPRSQSSLIWKMLVSFVNLAPEGIILSVIIPRAIYWPK
jgi:hypothetical protein